MNLVKRNNALFPALMNEFFSPDWFGGIESHTHYTPKVNIKELEKGYELALAVPGFKKEDFNIDVDKDVLTIAVEAKEENKTEVENYTRREFHFSAFKRSFSLPETVDSEKIAASYEDGILSLSLPKKEEALPKPKRLIELS